MRIIESLEEVSGNYDALFVDLWGCVHDGVSALPDAIAALQDYRKPGGKVVLLTNSPRPWAAVAKQLVGFGVPDDAWDTLATSGDSARAALFRGAVGETIYVMGTEEETAAFLAPLNQPDDAITPISVPLNQAEGILCCGPFDPLADPSMNRADFLYAKQKGLKLLCANPDIVVDRGHNREWCAGALATLYTEMGGESLYFGKPYPPIYDLARRRLLEIGAHVSDSRILAIGDGIQTDIKGAMGENIDSLFISGGLAGAETKTTHQPDEAALKTYIQKELMEPTFAIGHLR